MNLEDLMRLRKRGAIYILGSCAESLPVGDVRIAGLDALDLISIDGQNSAWVLARLSICYNCTLKGKQTYSLV
jgi:hypothetical protein